jgi:hypothetical protein
MPIQAPTKQSQERLVKAGRKCAPIQLEDFAEFHKSCTQSIALLQDLQGAIPPQSGDDVNPIDLLHRVILLEVRVSEAFLRWAQKQIKNKALSLEEGAKSLNTWPRQERQRHMALLRALPYRETCGFHYMHTIMAKTDRMARRQKCEFGDCCGKLSPNERDIQVLPMLEWHMVIVDAVLGSHETLVAGEPTWLLEPELIRELKNARKQLIRGMFGRACDDFRSWCDTKRDKLRLAKTMLNAEAAADAEIEDVCNNKIAAIDHAMTVITHIYRFVAAKIRRRDALASRITYLISGFALQPHVERFLDDIVAEGLPEPAEDLSSKWETRIRDML